MRKGSLSLFCLLTISSGFLGLFSAVQIFAPENQYVFFDIEFKGSLKDRLQRLIEVRINKTYNKINSLNNDLIFYAPKNSERGDTAIIKSLSEPRANLDEKKVENTTIERVADYKAIRLRDSLEAELKYAKITLANSKKEYTELNYYHTDVSLTPFYRYFWVPSRLQFLNYLREDDSITKNNAQTKRSGFKVLLVDTTFGSYQNAVKDTTHLLVKSKSKLDFIDKYPAFGVWLVFSIGQMTVWFIIGALIVGLTFKAIRDTKPWKSKSENDSLAFLLILIFVIAVEGTFIYLIDKVLIDESLLNDNIFLHHLGDRLTVYSYAGYLVAGICFTSYLVLAHKVNQLNDRVGSASKSNEKGKYFATLNSTFREAFLLGGLILSLFVLWLGIMFNAVNSLDVMQFYHEIFGKKYLNNDFIYLVGLMHSLLLLVFYVPVQVVFNSVDIVKELKNDNPAGLSNTKMGLINFFQSISTILITASPLLTSIIQGIIENLLKN